MARRATSHHLTLPFIDFVFVCLFFILVLSLVWVLEGLGWATGPTSPNLSFFALFFGVAFVGSLFWDKPEKAIFLQFYRVFSLRVLSKLFDLSYYVFF